MTTNWQEQHARDCARIAELEAQLAAFQQAVLEHHGTLWTSIQIRAAQILEENNGKHHSDL